MFGTFREMNRLVGRARENDITAGVDCSDWRRPERSETRILYQLILLGLFVFFVGLAMGKRRAGTMVIVAEDPRGLCDACDVLGCFADLMTLWRGGGSNYLPGRALKGVQ